MDVDLRDFVFRVLEIAKENLQRDGVLVPVAFLVTPGQVLALPVTFEAPEQKAAAYQDVIATARERGALAIITLNDAHYKREPNPDYVEAYYPGRLADEKAPECIYMTVSGPDLATWDLTVPYDRTEAGIVFREAQESNGGSVGFLVGWASESSKPS